MKCIDETREHGAELHLVTAFDECEAWLDVMLFLAFDLVRRSGFRLCAKFCVGDRISE